jgi:hypothetical protein
VKYSITNLKEFETFSYSAQKLEKKVEKKSVQILRQSLAEICINKVIGFYFTKEV